eukprot:CAMPEP_0113296938 /NCGR_PEP_ID=MMETSP0010_2-20120614/13_1 /TAXON_ID=216773 ORGANISM="Corethron hystrix, Strain 308" /NCGR_SAMPLE_ID=MMETSP0010_2 /ASSEMBLY_ACC=CAM_ASM_000155 /LENGTH=219 /DNA_ID=CAMNT_0000149753 /DNA_START=242 /DNA_END=898 /DNA_ORIENTATION=- /assembly_acc=CAM_ASM_000155
MSPNRQSIADREPCPWRIIDDVGGAFCMGAIGGTIWHSVKGFKNAPTGGRTRGALTAVKARGPVLGGAFAVWGGLFACCDCTITAIRQKEDPWNSICSGAVTGGILAARAGPRAAGQSALIGGVLLALIEGMGIWINKAFAPPVPTAEDYAAAQVVDPTAPPVQAGISIAPPANNPATYFPPSAPTGDNFDSSGESFSVESTSYQGNDTQNKTSSGGGW